MNAKLMEISSSVINLVAALIVLFTTIASTHMLKSRNAKTTASTAMTIKPDRFSVIIGVIWFFIFLTLNMLGLFVISDALFFCLGGLYIVLYMLEPTPPSRFDVVIIAILFSALVYELNFYYIKRIIDVLETVTTHTP
ncbi:MAG TPA: hypothetical protein VL633_06245 [Bacteroidota bacterium]|nr:hypothetical protein [Bacteroidota bacterium]